MIFPSFAEWCVKTEVLTFRTGVTSVRRIKLLRLRFVIPYRIIFKRVLRRQYSSAIKSRDMLLSPAEVKGFDTLGTEDYGEVICI